MRERITRNLINSGEVKVTTRYEDDSRPLHWAHTVGIAELLISLGARVNARDYYKRTPLHVATKLSVVKLLIYNGAYVNARDELIRNGANVNALNHI